MISLSDEIALVTGASRGIGQAIALALGSCGATVVGTATSSKGAEEITNYLKINDISGQGMVLNVTDQASVDALIGDLEKSLGAPSILVNNAGITRDGLLLRMKESDWDEIMDTNLKSLYRMTKACMRPMTKARKGRIVNITSVVGATGNIGQSNYAAAKAGVMGFTKAMALELAGRNVTVNAVAPGFIDTDMTRSLSDEHKHALVSRIPLGRLGQPEDIGNAVAFLASPEASYITGVTLHVNGGMYMS
jgi:3-oxoacyl-[acyl-carrier protein] reductase